MSALSFLYYPRRLGNIEKKVLTNIAILIARDDFRGLVSNLTSNAINKLEIKISGKGIAGQEKDLLYLLESRYEWYY